MKKYFYLISLFIILINIGHIHSQIFASGDLSINIWDLNSKINNINTANEVYCLELLSTDYLVSGSKNGIVSVWDLRNYSKVFDLIYDSSDISAILVYNEYIFFTSSSGGSVMIWNSKSLVNLYTDSSLHSNKITGLKFIRNKSLVVSSSSDGYLKISNFTYFNKSELKTSYNTENQIFSLTVLQNGYIITGLKNGIVNIYNYSSDIKLIQSLNNNRNEDVLSLKILNEIYLICGIRNIKIWNIKNIQNPFLIETLSEFNVDVLSLELINNDLLLSGYSDNSIRIWNLNSYSLIKSFVNNQGNIYALKLISNLPLDLITTLSSTLTSSKETSTSLTTIDTSTQKAIQETSPILSTEKTTFDIKSNLTTTSLNQSPNTSYQINFTTQINSTFLTTKETIQETSKILSTDIFNTTIETTFYLNNQNYSTTNTNIKIYVTTNFDTHNTNLTTNINSILPVLNFNAINFEQMIILLSDYDLSNCLVNCTNNGRCVLSLNKKFICECFEHFDGPSCQHDLRPCSSNPCLNNGTCTNIYTNSTTSLINYNCECNEYYYGSNCELKKDICQNETCSKHGNCKDIQNEAKCECFYLYNGTYCELETSEKQIINVVIKTSTIIGIITLVLFYTMFFLLDITYTKMFNIKNKTSSKNNFKQISLSSSSTKKLIRNRPKLIYIN